MEIIGGETVLAYADDIVLLENTREETHSLSKLIEASKWVYVSTKKRLNL